MCVCLFCSLFSPRLDSVQLKSALTVLAEDDEFTVHTVCVLHFTGQMILNTHTFVIADVQFCCLTNESKVMLKSFRIKHVKSFSLVSVYDLYTHMMMFFDSEINCYCLLFLFLEIWRIKRWCRRFSVFGDGCCYVFILQTLSIKPSSIQGFVFYVVTLRHRQKLCSVSL